MSIPVYFKNVNKRENSNDRFSIVGMTSVDCILKAGTSLTHPVLEIQIDNTTDVVTYSQYNEAYIQSFDRYYFIRDWQMKGRKMLCYCEVDVLASFWNDIKDQTFYISRSTQAVNPDLPDGMVATMGGYQLSSQYTRSPLAVSSATSYGSFIVAVINKNGSLGGITYYLMSYLTFMSFCVKLFDISSFGTFTGITDDVAKVIVNPFQYVASCIWLPFDVNAIRNTTTNTATTTVSMGYWNMTLTASVYTLDALSPMYNTMQIFNIHRHPSASTTMTYLNLAPYSKYSLYLYPFGFIDLDPLDLYHITQLHCMIAVDLRTGMGILKLAGQHTGTTTADYDTQSQFKVLTAQVGVEIGVASLKYYLPQGKSDIVANVAVGLDSYGGIPGLFDRIGNTIAQGIMDYASDRGISNDFIDSLQISESGKMVSGQDVSNIVSSAVTARNTAECLGMTGAISLMNSQQMTFVHRYLPIAQRNIDNVGMPCDGSYALTVFTVAGFVLCNNAHPQVSRATLTEKRMLTNMLNSGFYVVGS